MFTVLVNLSIVGTPCPHPPLSKGGGGGFEFSNFLQKKAGGGCLDFSHKKEGVGKLGELF